MFLNISADENKNIIVERHNRQLDKFIFLCTSLYTENAQVVDYSFEINQEKYFGKDKKNHRIT